jgi:phosphatidylserine/phosphatidylglycerophosphate/cardiolipin synthase-like enzyme
MIRILLVLILLVHFGFAKQTIFILPHETTQAKETLLSHIKKSQKSIDIAMYNFTYTKVAKALRKAHKRGVRVRILFDKSKIKKKSQYEYLKNSGIECFIASEKMHIKAALFDGKILSLGSMNWKKESFSKNYELLYFTDHKKSIQKFQNFFETMAR